MKIEISPSNFWEFFISSTEISSLLRHFLITNELVIKTQKMLSKNWFLSPLSGFNVTDGDSDCEIPRTVLLLFLEEAPKFRVSFVPLPSFFPLFSLLWKGCVNRSRLKQKLVHCLRDPFSLPSRRVETFGSQKVDPLTIKCRPHLLSKIWRRKPKNTTPHRLLKAKRSKYRLRPKSDRHGWNMNKVNVTFGEKDAEKS